MRKVIVIAILDYKLIDLPEYITKTVRVAREHREYELNNNVEYIYIELKKFREQNPNMKETINQWLAFIDMERGDLLEMAKKNSKIIKEAYGEYEVLTGDAEVKRLEEVRLMSRLEEQAALASARQRGTEEGLKQGKEEGLKQGKKEGLKQGKEEGLKQGKEEGLKQGKEEGLKQGKEEGLKQGEKEEKIRTTKKLLERNMPIEQIEEITGLTKDEILKIRDNNS